MNLFYSFIFILFSWILLLGCSSSNIYLLKYETYLANSEQKNLKFKDDKFEFEFLPVPNGIYFTIKNLTDKSAFLIWDQSYFIEPNGNTSKALNVDLLEENEKTVLKSKYESILPSKARFTRFTTSTRNLEKFRAANINMIQFSIFPTQLTTVLISNKVFYNYGRYWKNFENDKNVPFDYQLEKIKSYVLMNNNLGLGLVIRMDEENYEYRFDFEFKRVDIYKLSNNENGKLEKIMTMDESNGWNWEEIK